MRVLRFVPYSIGVIAIWIVSSMERPPVPEELVFWNSDKLLHMLAYAVLASLALIAVHDVTHAKPARRTGVIAFAMSALYGCLDEVHQSFVPGRSTSLLDLIADSLGAFLVASAYVWIARKRIHSCSARSGLVNQ